MLTLHAEGTGVNDMHDHECMTLITFVPRHWRLLIISANVLNGTVNIDKHIMGKIILEKLWFIKTHTSSQHFRINTLVLFTVIQ